jgi:hypothetical protein
MADGQFVPGVELTFDHADTVDANTVGAVQIAYDQKRSHLGDTAVAPGNFPGFNLNVAFRMTANQQDRLIQHDVGTIS